MAKETIKRPNDRNRDAKGAWTSPIPPGVSLDFWNSAYQAIDD